MRNLGITYNYIGNVDKSESYYKQAWEQYKALEDKGGEAAILINQGINYFEYESDFPGAQDYYQRALDLLQKIGDRKGEGVEGVD